MKRMILASLLVLASTVAQAQVFKLEFWPAYPDRTRQVQHFFACRVGDVLVIRRTTLPPVAEVGAFVFVPREIKPFLGLYKITNVEIEIDVDNVMRGVTITAICTTGLS